MRAGHHQFMVDSACMPDTLADPAAARGLRGAPRDGTGNGRQHLPVTAVSPEL